MHDHSQKINAQSITKSLAEQQPDTNGSPFEKETFAKSRCPSLADPLWFALVDNLLEVISHPGLSKAKLEEYFSAGTLLGWHL